MMTREDFKDYTTSQIILSEASKLRKERKRITATMNIYEDKVLYEVRYVRGEDSQEVKKTVESLDEALELYYWKIEDIFFKEQS